MTSLSPVAQAEDRDPGHDQHTLYVDANITSGNAILAYRIKPDGRLVELPGSPFPTGGDGFFDSSFKLGPFDVDQEMALSHDLLYAVNAGSDSISAMRIEADGSLQALPGQPFPSGGSTPVSLGLHGETIVVVNSAQDPEQTAGLPGLSVSAIARDGALYHIPGSGQALPAAAQPSQALTTNTGPFVFTAEFPGVGDLLGFYQGDDGRLYPTANVTLPLEANNVQPLPLGLWANPKGPYLYVGFVNTNEVGVYTWNEYGRLRFITKVSNAGTAVCWLRVSADGRFLYTANTADESMTVYSLKDPAAPEQIQHIVVGGLGGVQQFSLTPDGKFLYLLQEENSTASVGESNKIYVLSVNQESGKLTLLSDFTTQLELPPMTRPFGVAIR